MHRHAELSRAVTEAYTGQQLRGQMPQSYMGYRKLRRSFGRIPEVAAMPNLIEVQKKSYEHFLQKDTRADQRGDYGLQEVFKSVFPIKDFADAAALEFVKYEFEPPKYDVEECQQRVINQCIDFGRIGCHSHPLTIN